jgi:hypothetical protein
LVLPLAQVIAQAKTAASPSRRMSLVCISTR